MDNKIEPKLSQNDIYNYDSMKPSYTINDELMCGVINYNNNTYLVDLKDRDKIINFNKNFVFINKDDIYPSYSSNYKRFNYVDFIFNYSQESVCYDFKNGNHFDLRICNVEIYHEAHKKIVDSYNVIEYIKGHYLTVGQDANIMKNPIWRIEENKKDYLLMYCEKDTICKLCPESYQKIINFENNGKKITWFKLQNGYIMCSNNYYIHQIITGCYGNGKGTKNISVDHIDQNPLNNSWENLRVATREEQEQNSKGIKPDTKRERKYNAKDLPEGITHNMMKKYVVYYQEWLDKDHTCQREYFKIEKHPKLDKIWIGTKSNKVSIQEKLLQVNKVVVDLECDIYPEKQKIGLPKYISLVTIREKPHLVYDQKTNDGRMCIKMVLPEEYDLHSQLEILNDKIKEKYKDHVITI
jgi:hypothetical protein